MRRLIIRPGAIGDTILSFPALEYLRAEYTEIWVRSEIVPLIEFASVVRPLSSTGIDLLGIPGVEPPADLIRHLASFDEIVSWYGANRPEFREELASFCRNIRFLPAIPDRGNRKHAADFFLDQAGGSGPAVPRIATRRTTPGDFVVIHPLSGSPSKNWPYDQYLELEQRLIAAGNRVEWAARPDWVRFEKLSELAEWLSQARLYIGNDSGITHLAAACGTPVLALFGPTDPATWAPRGDAVRILRAEPLPALTVDEVLNALRTPPTQSETSPTAP